MFFIDLFVYLFIIDIRFFNHRSGYKTYLFMSLLVSIEDFFLNKTTIQF